MGLRIATNIASQSVQKNIKESSEESTSLLDKLSSGRRITKAADDASGLAIATNLRAQIQSLRQATRNANDGISLIQTAEGGLNEISKILTRLRQLSIQASSDTIGEKERGFLTKEYEELVEEVNRIALVTKFKGASLLNGEGESDIFFHVGPFAGEENQIHFDSSIYDVGSDFLGIDDTKIEDREDSLDAIEVLDEALDIVNAQRADFGSIQSRLQSTVNNLEVQTINQENARSVIEDVDVAEAVSKLASYNVVKNAGIASLAQANVIPNAALKLI